MSLLRPAGGRVQVNTPRARIAYMPQLTEIDRTFPMSVQDCVQLGCWAATGAWGRVTPALRQRVANAITEVGLTGFEQRSVGSLSSGQLQRVLLLG